MTNMLDLETEVRKALATYRASLRAVEKAEDDLHRRRALAVYTRTAAYEAHGKSSRMARKHRSDVAMRHTRVGSILSEAVGLTPLSSRHRGQFPRLAKEIQAVGRGG